MEAMYAIVGVIVGVGIGVLVGYLVRGIREKQQQTEAGTQATTILAEARVKLKEAEKDAERLRQEATVKNKADLVAQREALQEEIQKERNELKATEKRLTKREDNLDRKTEVLDNKEEQLRLSEEKLAARAAEIEARTSEIDDLVAQQKDKLFEIAKLTPDAARDEVLTRTEREMESEIAELIERATNRAKEEAEGKSRDMVLNAINRLAVDYTAEHVVSTVELPSDDMKGRIIGREGRNIRAFENATGVDVIVDDTPGVVVLSGFEPVRREIAVRSMAKLVSDGRIHPARIEEVVTKTREEMEKVIEETGKEVALELDVRNLKPREIMLLGRLRFRTSYGQNVLDHAREVGLLSGMLAMQLGLDENLGRRCGLLHDIGKAVDHEQEGTHPELGADVARMCGEPQEVLDSILHHHTPGAAESLYATIVQAADAISAGRPGARRESLENYIKRLERLETIANSYPAIEKSFAIQAGRELRVFASAEKMSDADAARTCRQIAKQIEDELTYPGEVKITLVREFRITEFAR